MDSLERSVELRQPLKQMAVAALIIVVRRGDPVRQCRRYRATWRRRQSRSQRIVVLQSVRAGFFAPNEAVGRKVRPDRRDNQFVDLPYLGCSDARGFGLESARVGLVIDPACGVAVRFRLEPFP